MAAAKQGLGGACLELRSPLEGCEQRSHDLTHIQVTLASVLRIVSGGNVFDRSPHPHQCRF